MKICLVHNDYGKPSGEESVVLNSRRLLEEHGHTVLPFTRGSSEIGGMKFGRFRAFFSGIYSGRSRKDLGKLLEREKPDIVHVHNLFPLISPSILVECRKKSVPVVMTVHNYRLICPNGLFAHNGRICEKCSGGKEYWCLLQNCENSIFKSAGYALRNWVARKKRFFLDNVTIFAPLTEFQRRRLIAEGYDESRIVVIPNMTDCTNRPSDAVGTGAYVGAAGRLSREKGIDLLLEAAAKCRNIPFRIAGAGRLDEYSTTQIPSNVTHCGYLENEDLKRFYEQTKILVVASRCYEGFPMTILEAMSKARPVICPGIGGFPEIVDDGVTGFLFEAGNAGDLAETIRYLWDRPELCLQMGRAGQAKAHRDYSEERYYKNLMSVYGKALRLRQEEQNGRRIVG